MAERLSPEDVRKLVREQVAYSPSEEMVESRRKIFSEVDEATIQSGIVPRIYEQAMRHLPDSPQKIIILDTVELSAGAPFPVATRYIMPFNLDETHGKDEEADEKAEEEYANGTRALPDFLPGAIIRRWPVGRVDIQIGLDMDADVFKIARRFFFWEAERSGDQSFAAPYWWPYEFPAEDLTQEVDLRASMFSSALLTYADDMDSGLMIFSVGNRRMKAELEEITFSEKEGEDNRIVWDTEENRMKVEAGFEQLETYYNRK